MAGPPPAPLPGPPSALHPALADSPKEFCPSFSAEEAEQCVFRRELQRSFLKSVVISSWELRSREGIAHRLPLPFFGLTDDKTTEGGFGAKGNPHVAQASLSRNC